MTLDPARLDELLKTKTLGRPAICLEETDSTNLFLKARLGELPPGTAVLTLRQTAGRGRLGRSWVGGDGLALSVLLRLAPGPARSVPLCAGYAVCAALSKLYPAEFQIKWPNDILCRGRKICGILCESNFDSRHEGLDLVCGIGVNLLQSDDQLAKAGLPYASSIHACTGVKPDPEACAAEILAQLEGACRTLESGRFSLIREQYVRRCVTLHRHVRVTLGEEELSAFALDVAEDGALIVDAGGQTRRIYASEASVRGLFDYA